MNNTIVDLLIIGGGINGTAIAADAAGRGLSVILCEQNDLASGTSSASTKLIHGGLRYLEHYDFKMVRESLREREVLLTRAPHLIRPMEFILPINKNTRPSWMISIGLFLYDHLAKRKYLPASHKFKLTHDPRGIPLRINFTKGYSYYDCFSDDSRLVISNALSAKQNGATILTHHQVIKAKSDNKLWEISLRDNQNNAETTVFAKGLINAAGPWVNQVLDNIALRSQIHCKLIKGSHIIVPKFYLGNQAYFLQNSDQRIVFVIPYFNDYLLIGTTDIVYQDSLTTPIIEKEEIQYLCGSVNSYFNKTIQPLDVVKSFSGIRALVGDDEAKPQAIKRGYKLEVNKTYDQTPLLSVFGGKLTTHRCLAEQALALLKPFFPHQKAEWTAKVPLPGGDIAHADMQQYLNEMINRYHWLPIALVKRYVDYYGTLINKLLENTNDISDLGQYFGTSLYQREVDYLIENEWAQSVEDILWRRTKLGLKADAETLSLLAKYLDEKVG